MQRPDPINKSTMFGSFSMFPAIICLLLILVSCKSSPTEPNPPPSSRYYDIATITLDIFSGSEAGGTVIINGERKESGGTFSVKEGRIDSIFVEVPGYIPDYIFCQSETGETLLTRDASGLNCPALTTDITLYLKLIPSDFDVKRLAKCLGGDQYDGDPRIPGRGIVQRYLKAIVPVIYHKGQSDGPLPTNETINRLENAVDSANAAFDGLIFLEYKGYAETGALGVIYAIREFNPPSHWARIQDNVIEASGLYTKDDASAQEILENLVRALGIRRNGGGADYPYISDSPNSPTFVNDGERALQLISLLPPGFKLKLD